MSSHKQAPRTHTAAVRRFIKDSPWLSDEDAPAVAVLKAVAAELDSQDKVNPSLIAQYQLTYRNLIKRAPSKETDNSDSDPVEEFLNGNG